jgi:preprotein translocase subunit SecE
MSIAKGEKTGLFSSMRKGYRGVVGELKKVHWPTKKEIVAYTMVVILSVFLIGVAIWVIDAGVGYCMNLIIQ